MGDPSKYFFFRFFFLFSCLRGESLTGSVLHSNEEIQFIYACLLENWCTCARMRDRERKLIAKREVFVFHVLIPLPSSQFDLE